MKYTLIKLLLGLICLLVYSVGHAQQEAKFTFFNHNYPLLNPAAAASKDKLNFGMLYRYQWAGYSGAPKTMTAFAELPILALRSGVGVSYMNESIGILKTNALAVNYAFILRISGSKRLAFGVKLGFNQNTIGFSSLTTDPNNANISADPNLNYGNDLSIVSPTVGAGIYYYSNLLKLGFSIPNMVRNTVQGSPSSGDSFQHMYLMGGYNFIINRNVYYNPRVLVSFVKGAPLQIDFYNQFTFNKKIAAGVSFRSGESMALFMSYVIKEQLTINYAYDMVIFNSLRAFQGGSHELMLSYFVNWPNHEKSLKRLKLKEKQECIDFDDPEKTKLHEEIRRIYYGLD